MKKIHFFLGFLDFLENLNAKIKKMSMNILFILCITSKYYFRIEF